MIELYYLSECRKELVDTIELSKFDPVYLPEILLKVYQNRGYLKATDAEKLYARIDEDFISLKKTHDLADASRIIYIDLLGHHNAAEFAREDGISYFFHPSEKPHLNYPHVHAGYGGEEISISLSDFKVIGRFKSRSKQKEAVEYVKDAEHLRKLRAEWNRLVGVPE